MDIGGIRLLTDIPLPDGTHFTVWRGLNSDGSMCQAELLDDGDSDADDVTTWCYVDESAGRIDDVSVAPVWAPETSSTEGSQPKYFVSFGEAPSDKARTVHISGHDTDVVLDVDPVSGGFGGELTVLEMTPDGEKFELIFSFRDAANKEVAVGTHGWG